MKQRIITGLVLIAVILPCVIFGGIPFQIVMAFVGVMSVFELLSICTHAKANIYLYGLLGVFVLYSLFFSKGMLVPNTYVILYLLILLTCGIFDYGMPIDRLCYYFTSAVLVAYGLHMIYYLRASMDLSFIIMLAFVTFGADTGAYFIGSKFGKHKLNPRLSPKKTIEGSIGGIVIGTVAGVAFGLCAHMPLANYSLILICFVLSITGQIGDLTFSSIKRLFEVKDYSQIFPGHGGCLDRFDSIIFNAMVLGFMLHYLPMVVK